MESGQEINDHEIKEIQELNQVIKSAVNTMEASKEQIFEIAENAKAEGERIRQELEWLRQEVEKVIDTYDQYEREYRRKRNKLSEVSKNFHLYSEDAIRAAYEDANQIQVELKITGEREQYLKKHRDDLQMRLKNVFRTIDRAESLITQVGVVLQYLQGDIARMSEQLESAKHGQLFGLKIIEAQEEERKRVSREIHDGPAQSMANVVVRAELADRMLSQDNVELAIIELQELKKLARNSLSDVRRIIYDLRPMALDDLGLIPALRKFVEAYDDSKQFNIEFVFTGVERRLPSSMEVAIYRLVQEGMNNIAKHAQAKNVKVLVDLSPQKIQIVVKDDGIGFKREDTNPNEKFGIMGMRERVRLLAGDFKISSKPSQGTKLMITIPLPEKE